MYNRHSEEVAEMRELAVQRLVKNQKDADRITDLMCQIIQADSLLQPFPYNVGYQTTRSKCMAELKEIL